MDYSNFINDKVKMIKHSGIRKFFDIANEMEGVISLGVGEPDFHTAQEIREAAIIEIKAGKTQYTSNKGSLEFRIAIADYLNRRFNLNYNESEIIVTVGASEALDVALRTILSPMDEVLIPEPSYVCYQPDVVLAGGNPVFIKTDAENNFKITASMIKEHITPKTKVLMLPFPANPTGAILEKADLEEIAEVVKEHNLLVVTDEVYAELTYGANHISFASIKDMKERTITINGFSKAFCMTGWRIGYIACPKELVDEMLKVHQYVIMCAPTMGQQAAEYALKKAFSENFKTINSMREEFNRRREYVINSLNSMGLNCHNARGAFYAFPCVASTKLNGDQFAERFLRDYKVAVVPGSAFGSMTDYVRISYAASMDKLVVAMERMKEFVEKLKM